MKEGKISAEYELLRSFGPAELALALLVVLPIAAAVVWESLRRTPSR